MNRSMMKNARVWRVLVVLLVLGMPFVSAEEKKLYRYRNAEGVLVIDHKVPPEFVAKGYDVVNVHGRLILRVPPYIEKQDGSADTSDLESQRASDEYLLRSYSSVAEIDAASERKLQQLESEIHVIEKNLEDTREMRKSEQKRAANLQRGGRKVSDTLLRQIEVLAQQERDALRMLDVRRKEYAQVDERYKGYAERYRRLTAGPPKESPDETGTH